MLIETLSLLYRKEKNEKNVGLPDNDVQRTVHSLARQCEAAEAVSGPRGLTVASPWLHGHLTTLALTGDTGLTTRPARGLGPASRTTGHGTCV